MNIYIVINLFNSKKLLQLNRKKCMFQTLLHSVTYIFYVSYKNTNFARIIPVDILFKSAVIKSLADLPIHHAGAGNPGHWPPTKREVGFY